MKPFHGDRCIIRHARRAHRLQLERPEILERGLLVIDVDGEVFLAAQPVIRVETVRCDEPDATVVARDPPADSGHRECRQAGADQRDQQRAEAARERPLLQRAEEHRRRRGQAVLREAGLAQAPRGDDATTRAVLERALREAGKRYQARSIDALAIPALAARLLPIMISVPRTV